MSWYAVYGCGCVYEMEEGGHTVKYCPRHNAVIRVGHWTREWVERTPEYTKGKAKGNRHYPW